MMQKKIWSSVVLLFLASFVMAQVTGRVEDEYGPLSGAGVSVVGTTNTTETGADGTFSIKGKKGDVLVITDPGTLNQKKFVVKKLNMGVLKMKQKVVNLDVVVAFGKQKKENLTGAVSVVDSKAFEGRPVSNAVQALQGKIAGMNFNVGSNSTELDGSPSINLRGIGTIGEGSQSSPLVLIDGMEGDLSSINPQDIESISVLKDAAASSIYGSRAAFGVILITTKSGKNGKFSVNYNTSFRMRTPTLIPKMMDSQAFVYYFGDAYRNIGLSDSRFNNKQIEKIIKYKLGMLKFSTEWDATSGSGEDWRTYTAWDNIDWYKQFYRDWSPSQEHNLTIRGGANKIKYYVSANYLGEEGLMRYNTDTNGRFALSGKFSAQINKWMNLQYQSRFTRQTSGKSSYLEGSSGDFYEQVIKTWPIYPLKDPNGNYMYGNHISHVNMGRFKRERDLLAQQLNFTFTPLKNWNIYMNLAYQVDTRFDSRYYLPLYRYDKNGNKIYAAPKFKDRRLWRTLPLGYSMVQELAYKTNYFSPNIYSDYSREFGLHSFKVMLGFQSEQLKRRQFNALRDGILNDKVISIHTTEGNDVRVDGTYDGWATMGVFGRLNYNYDDKYLLEFNLRYDGTSRFLRDQRWNWYPSASIGWNIARERFWANLGGIFDKFNTFKIRASYGELGNQNTSNWYPFYQIMPFKPNVGEWLIDGHFSNTATSPGLISKYLTWERVSTANLGLDVSAFRNRLDLSLDVFQRKTLNMVGPAPELPADLGTREPKMNNTDMVSNGFELSLGWRDKIGKDFSYSINGTLTDSRQEVTRYPNFTGSIQQYYSGRMVGEIWGFVTHGIAKTQKEMNDWLANHDQSQIGSNWSAGDIMFEDLNGDGRITTGTLRLDDPGDLKIIGNSTPRYNFGLDFSMKYKNFDFRAFFQGTGKRDLDLSTLGYKIPNSFFTGANTAYRNNDAINIWPATAFVQHLDYFRPKDTQSPFGPNEDAYFPRPLLGQGYKNFPMPQTRYIQDGAYIRLKNIQLGYTLPKKLMKKVGLYNVRVYLSAENLYTWTRLIDIFDPEVVSGIQGQGKMYPMSRIISTGLSLTF